MRNPANERYTITIAPHLPVCANCCFLIRHYLKNGQPLECGHCTEPRIKNRNSYDYCANFTKKKGNE